MEAERLNGLRHDQLELLYGMMERMLQENAGSERTKRALTEFPAVVPVNSVYHEAGKREMSLRSLVDEYERFVGANHSNGYALSVKSGNWHLMNYFGDAMQLRNIRLREAEALLVYLQKHVAKGYRVYFRNIKAMFNKAIDWEYLEKNPFVKVKLPKRQETAPAYITHEELEEVRKHIPHSGIWDVVTFAFFTGCRLGEIRNLSWDNVDLPERLITVGSERFTTKTRKQRKIPVCKELFELLSRKADQREIISSRDEYVFAKEDRTPYSADFISKSFKRACKDAKLSPAIHFHSLRHSFASNLVQKGTSLYLVRELLGHSSITTTEIYSHVNIVSLRDAMKVFDAIQEPKQEAIILPINSNSEPSGNGPSSPRRSENIAPGEEHTDLNPERT